MFIQKYGTNSNYANEEGKNINKSLQNTGLSGDIQVNICDMAANCFEFSTETRYATNCVVERGGVYFNNFSGFTADRRGDIALSSTATAVARSFRSILYL